MEIGKQIKKLRGDMSLSQDDLAMKIYVSRQTISNWENDKSYPDVKSLLLLSALFDVSIDQLVKGDVEEMKEAINSEVMEKFKKDSKILTSLFLLMIVSMAPLYALLKVIGVVIWGGIVIVTFYYAFKVEKQKKNFNIQTYKEIINFIEGNSLEGDEKQQEVGKRSYQKVLLGIGAAIVAIAVTGGLLMLFGQ